MLVCLNGNFIAHEHARIPINDGGLLFGDTLFETLKARGKKILLVNEHLDRLQLSAKLLDFPCDRKQIEISIQQLSNALTTATSRIRLTIGRGQHQGLTFPEPVQNWFLLTAAPFTEPTDTERDNGAACVISPNRRVNPVDHLPQMKRGNYADCLYAANYAGSKGAREALFIDEENNLLEGSTSNLFAFFDNRLITPPIEKTILAGVMRRQIIDAATELGFLTTEKNLPKNKIFEADETFISNSLIDLLPLSSIDGHPVKQGTNWKQLYKTLQMRIGT